MAEILRREIVLACPPPQAFRAFTEHVDLWWPRGHRKGQGGRLRFTVNALVHTAPDGAEWTMAEVKTFEPPNRLELEWFPGSPTAPTHVAIAFEATGGGTMVTIVHQPLTPAATNIWPQRVGTFAGGWDAVLSALNDHIKGDHNG